MSPRPSRCWGGSRRPPIANSNKPREQLELFFQARLAEIDRSLASVFDTYARELTAAIEKSDAPIETLRQLDRESPIVRTSLFVTSSGVLAYPPTPSSNASEEVALYASLPAIISSKPDLTQPIEFDVQAVAAPSKGKFAATKPTIKAVPSKVMQSKVMPSQAMPAPSIQRESSSRSSSLRKDSPTAKPTFAGKGQWQVWYMDEGIQLIHWTPRSDGAAVGILLERARWIADLTASLPDSSPVGVPLPSSRSAPRSSGFTALTDESNDIVYRWGDDRPRANSPLASRTLSPPLTSWHLEYHSDDPLPGSASTGLVASLAGIGVVLMGLGAYVVTGVQRQMRTARNRVSFASQVSHELRTPLTNIRLYAELAESDLQQLPEGDSRSSIQKRLEVIDTESRRLGRLVSGVLEMIRDNRKQQGPRITSNVPDRVIDQTLMQFEPSFERAELSVHRDLTANRAVGLDADILEMILVNLLSNVEKYASEGERVDVSSRMEGDQLIVLVADSGPGISWPDRRRIFRPFARLDDSIRAPSGTGIGLTIARRLARRHGGDLELVHSDCGACFELRMPTQYIDSNSDAEEQLEP